MVDLFAIKGAIDGLKAARDIAKTAIGLRDAALLQSKVIELNDAILSAQSSALDAQAAQSNLLERIRELEKQIADFEDWNTQKQRYELTEIGTGAFAYVLKPSVAAAEPVHCICSDCYERRQRVILQIVSNLYGGVTLSCPRCKAQVAASEDHPNYPLKRYYAKEP